jgi:hypothetical protein
MTMKPQPHEQRVGHQRRFLPKEEGKDFGPSPDIGTLICG